MQTCLELLTHHSAQVMAALCVISLVSLLIVVMLALQARRTNIRLRALVGQGTPGNMETMLSENRRGLESARQRLDQAEKSLDQLQILVDERSLRVGMVRFKGFPDMGSDLSFALALLDGKGSGVVILSLYGRDEARIYAKPIQNWTSEYQLTDEEMEAVERASSSAVGGCL